MGYILIPCCVFYIIEWVAYAQGLTHLATLALAGAFLCWGMQLGWWAWERAHKRANKVRQIKDQSVEEES